MPDFNNPYYFEQIITYIGNKRSLLTQIDDLINDVKNELQIKELKSVDLFSGSGIVARLLKSHSKLVIANDLELYSKIINECFLSNEKDFEVNEFEKVLDIILNECNYNPIEGIITQHYSPVDDNNIKVGERVFYCRKNAIFIDSFRHYIDIYAPEKLKKYFLALLVTEASIHVNTSGVFKGFYKDKNTGIGKFGGTAGNALTRILGDFKINKPYFCEHNSDYCVYQEDAITLSAKLPKVNLVYLDPPYNQHPYGSNYFMLNLILKNELPKEVSKVSGIPKDWNHSPFNKKNEALISMEKIINNLQSDYILISYNNEGFITYDEMYNMLSKYGKVRAKQIVYNTFRGSRNLRNRDIYSKLFSSTLIYEFLFLLRKEI